MSQTDPHPSTRRRCGALGMRCRPHRGQRRSKGYAVRHRADAAIGNLGFQPRSTGDGDGSRIGAVDLQTAEACQRCRAWHLAASREDQDAMKFCSKLILIPAVAIAAALLLPALAFAQVPPAPATAPPAVALPAIPPAQKVPDAKAPICRHRPRPCRRPIVPPALAEPNAVAAPPTAIALTLPRDLSPWGMFLAADIVVKAVMVGLVFASVLTWTIWFAKAFELLAARRRLRAGDRGAQRGAFARATP